MGMKVKLPTSFLTPKDYWPSCSHSPKTLSFRSPANPNSDQVFKTLNSVYFDDDNESSDEKNDREDDDVDYDIESIIRGAHSESTRIFFEPTDKTISAPIEEEVEEDEREEVGPAPFKESIAMAMESEDPYIDFRRSMEEMMETHGLLKDWGCLEELLAWYLKVNGRKNHAYIVAAFVDLLVKFSSSSSSSNSDEIVSSSLNVSSCSTSRSSSLCPCASCGDHQLIGRKSNAKSTTSFSSAASSFSCEQ